MTYVPPSYSLSIFVYCFVMPLTHYRFSGFVFQFLSIVSDMALSVFDNVSLDFQFLSIVSLAPPTGLIEYYGVYFQFLSIVSWLDGFMRGGTPYLGFQFLSIVSAEPVYRSLRLRIHVFQFLSIVSWVRSSGEAVPAHKAFNFCLLFPNIK